MKHVPQTCSATVENMFFFVLIWNKNQTFFQSLVVVDRQEDKTGRANGLPKQYLCFGVVAFDADKTKESTVWDTWSWFNPFQLRNTIIMQARLCI